MEQVLLVVVVVVVVVTSSFSDSAIRSQRFNLNL